MTWRSADSVNATVEPAKQDKHGSTMAGAPDDRYFRCAFT